MSFCFMQYEMKMKNTKDDKNKNGKKTRENKNNNKTKQKKMKNVFHS